ncbi:RNA methyltransferase [Candidatus Poribacteria bacterium]|nr:MAG: RNA methyltransferase [Candidatus Poribacteria bacterium]
MRITSQQNPHVKYLVSLHKRRERDLNQQFLVEGVREHQRLLASSYQIESIWYCPEITDRSEVASSLLEALQERATAGATQISSSVFSRVAYRGSSEGVISVVNQPTCTLSDLPICSIPFYLVAYGLEKPGNVGSIIRSADAVACDGVIVCNPRTDFFNPNVIRASIGTVFSVPVAATDPLQLLQWAESHEINLIATSPNATNSYTDTDLTRSCGIVIGEEQRGLPKSFLKHVAHTVRLPVLGEGDSLNAAICAAVMLFETRRQRSDT